MNMTGIQVALSFWFFFCHATTVNPIARHKVVSLHLYFQNQLVRLNIAQRKAKTAAAIKPGISIQFKLLYRFVTVAIFLHK